MDENRKIGAIIIIVSAALIGISLTLSDGWSYPTIQLYLFDPTSVGLAYHDPDWKWLCAPLEFLSHTRNIIAILITILAYGACCYFSLVSAPQILVKYASAKIPDTTLPSANADDV